MTNRDGAIHARTWVSTVPPARPLPVLMLHGLGVASRLCAPTGRRLGEAGHLTLAPDLPGFGLSPAQGEEVDIAALADVVAGWLPRVVERPVVVVGVSFGSQVAAELAARAPHLVAATVLVSPIVEPSRRRWRSLLPRWQLEQATQTWSLRALIAGDFFRCGPRRLLRTVSASLDHRMEDTVREITSPVLVLRGTRDPIASTEWAEDLAGEAGDGHVSIVPDAVHSMTYQNPDVTSRLIATFAEEATQIDSSRSR